MNMTTSATEQIGTSLALLDWSHSGSQCYNAFTYSYQLWVSRLASGKWSWVAYGLDDEPRACGLAETLELAQAGAEVWVTLEEFREVKLN